MGKANKDWAKAGGEQDSRSCIYCDKVFEKRRLRGHVEKEHKEAIRCDNRMCLTFFRTQEEKERHSKDVHSNERVLCEFCKRLVLKRSHHGAPTECSHCKKAFEKTREKECKKRVRYRCVVCRKAFRKMSTLGLHMESKCGKSPASKAQPAHRCDVCEKELKTKVALADHMTNNHLVIECKHCRLSVRFIYLHSEQKKCSQCEKSFRCNGLLENHRKICEHSYCKA